MRLVLVGLLLVLPPAAHAAAAPAAATTTTDESSINPPPIPLVVSCAANATAPERAAAEEMVGYLRSILGHAATVPPVLNATRDTAKTPQLAVGYGAARLLGVPAASLAGLGREGYILQSAAAGASLALSGGQGAPRGTLYAVNEFLEGIGVQFLTADATLLPAQLPPALPALRQSYTPTFEYRQTFGFQFLTSQDFNVHLRTNRAHFNNPVPMLDAKHGGSYPIFAAPPGSAHTSYSLLPGGAHLGIGGPPPDLFKSHRGWL